jgi:hypothetical protein
MGHGEVAKGKVINASTLGDLHAKKLTHGAP